MNIAKCRLCGQDIGKTKYRNALFCGDICRKKYYELLHPNRKLKTALKVSEDGS